MRDELEIVRSLGMDHSTGTLEAFARAEAALRREIERERTGSVRRRGAWGATDVRWRPHAHRGDARPRWRRWALWLAFPVAMVAAGAGYELTRASVDYAAGFGCYDKVSLSANVAVPGGDASNPVAACALVWREGAMGRPGSHATPPQTACVLPSGAIGVFPSDDPATCARLRLARLPADYARQAARVGELASTLRGVVDSTAGRCLTAAQASAVASRELVALGFTGWRVRTPQPFPAGGRCAAIALGQWQRTVLVLWAPPAAPPIAPARRAFAMTHTAIEPSTVKFLAGDGRFTAYSGFPRAGATPCVLVLGASTPRAVCAGRSRFPSMIVRLSSGTMVVAGAVSPASAAAGGVQVRAEHRAAVGLTVAPNGAFVGYTPPGTHGTQATLVALDRAGRPTVKARIQRTQQTAPR